MCQRISLYPLSTPQFPIPLKSAHVPGPLMLSGEPVRYHHKEHPDEQAAKCEHDRISCAKRCEDL